jgi:hypothetical protein
VVKSGEIEVMRGACVAIALGLFLAGCKAPPPLIVEAEGVVLLDGKPLNNVEVRFFPMIDYGPEYTAKGITDKNGRFQLTCNGAPGACACENRVIIVEPDLPPHLKSENAQAELARHIKSLGGRPLPQKYANLADSPLVAHVKAEQKEYKFELKR